MPQLHPDFLFRLPPRRHRNAHGCHPAFSICTRCAIAGLRAAAKHQLTSKCGDVNLRKSAFRTVEIGSTSCNLRTTNDAQRLNPIHLLWRCVFSHLCALNDRSSISVTEGWRLPSQVLSHCHPQASISL